MDNIINALNKEYGGAFSGLEVLRDFIGQVSKVCRGSEVYILKLYRNRLSCAAGISSEITEKLNNAGVRASRVILTVNGSSTFKYGDRLGILYEFISGTEPERDNNLAKLGKLCGAMRKGMEGLSFLPQITAQDFVNRYIGTLEKKNSALTESYRIMGLSLCNMVKDIPRGFMHGDFHCGNMLESNGEIALIDFDATAYGYPAYDIATLCDATDYFNTDINLMKNGLDNTYKNLSEFKRGYTEYFTITDAEKRAIPAFIMLRHYDIQHTIVESLGLNCVDENFIEKQYSWLVNFYELIA